jgi:hypothetical protein
MAFFFDLMICKYKMMDLKTRYGCVPALHDLLAEIQMTIDTLTDLYDQRNPIVHNMTNLKMNRKNLFDGIKKISRNKEGILKAKVGDFLKWSEEPTMMDGTRTGFFKGCKLSKWKHAPDR